MDDYSTFIATSRYARWRSDDERRETWEETVTRYLNYLVRRMENDGVHGYGKAMTEIHAAIVALEVMPSMRSLMTAGPALDRDNVAGYNCAYLPVDHPRAFDETMYILMCGTGVGFSVERQYINKLPEVPDHLEFTDTTISVADSKLGWASAFKELISLLYSGRIPSWDMSKVREAGMPLKTFGGRASGPAPLEKLFQFTVETFKRSLGRKLNSLECHDIMCAVGQAIVVGGVRRSACISLSNLTDERMRHAKSGQWWTDNPQRALANNSVAYTEKPDVAVFMREWSALHESKSGERGFFNREAARKQVERIGRRDGGFEFGVNPCSEIILRPNEFCNLSEVVVRAEDDLANLKRKVRLATILGTLQATLTDFRYLRPIWKRNTEEEALLGVSLTGIMDHPILSGQWLGGSNDTFEEGRSDNTVDLTEVLQELKEVAIETNKEWAAKLGINPAAAITCVKPSGTVSQLVDSASGIHSRFAPYYIRRVRNDLKDPMTTFLAAQGVPVEIDVTNSEMAVFSFPKKAPEGAVYTEDRTAIEQLEHWKLYQDHWCEHKPSVTIYYNDDEFMEVGAWVWKHFDEVSGISFLPYNNHIYTQAPYEAITEEQYNKMQAEFPVVEWTALTIYESEDRTTASQELACGGKDTCEI